MKDAAPKALLAVAAVLTGCGNVTSPTATSPGSPPLSATLQGPTTITAPSPDNSTQPSPRGLLSKESYWDEKFQKIPVSECIAQGDQKRGNSAADRGWRLPNGAIACDSDPSVGVWGNRIISFVLYFEPPTDAATATATALSLLPSDAQQTGSVEQVNLDWSIYRGSGSCKYLTFDSNSLGEAVLDAYPDWTGAAKRADVKLYSGNAVVPDGADQMYRSDSIHAATIGIASSGNDPGC